MLAILSLVQDEVGLVEARLQSVTAAAYPPLARALSVLLGSGGKRLRPALTILASKFHAGADGDAVTAAGAAFEMLHTATLVHDDLIDGTLLRRGSPTLNAAWDQASTVLAGDYIFAQAAELASETNDPRAIAVFARSLKTICEGELRQIHAHLNWEQPEEEYYRRIFSKTASLFAACVEVGAILSGAPESTVQSLCGYARTLGMAFQIVDDILDFTGDESVMGKPVGSDLRQGVLTLPAFYFASLYPDRQAELRSLLEKPGDGSGIARAVEMVRGSEAIEASRERARLFVAQARDALDTLPAGAPRDALFALADFVVERHL